MSNGRNPRLDEIRASAIVMVVVYHVSQFCPVESPAVNEWFRFGKYGVDLFFALSGWLVGGLYWKEWRRQRSVNIPRFIFSRLSRTVVPYLVALLVAWLGVWWFRGESFSWGYLVFAQNYYARIPFFLVSWSLCVEEHFYLAIPFILWIVLGLGRGAQACLLAAAMLPTLCRWLVSQQASDASFGYYETATHLHFDGLALGVWLSYIRYTNAVPWSKVVRLARWSILPLAVAFFSFGTAQNPRHYIWQPLCCAALFTSMLVAWEGVQVTLPSALARLVYAISVTSYSAYLTHAVAIDIARRLIGSLGPVPELVQPIVFLAVIALLTGIFFAIVERPILRWRRKALQALDGNARFAPNPMSG